MTNAYAAQIKFNSNSKIAKLRELLRRNFGVRKYRITADGEVHVYGVMRNTSRTGWYLLGYVPAVMSEYLI